jgi:hypothetical protein
MSAITTPLRYSGDFGIRWESSMKKSSETGTCNSIHHFPEMLKKPVSYF